MEKSVRSEQETRAKPAPYPVRWNTLEFYIYYAVYITFVPYLFYSAYQMSLETRPNYEKYKHLLAEGWLFGRRVDVSDWQTEHIRAYFPYFLLMMIGYLTLSHLSRLVAQERTTFLLPVGLVFLYLLHGNSIIKILAIVFANYLIGRLAGPSKLAPILTWSFNLAILFANQYCDGYRFGSVAASLSFLDHNKGYMSSWHVVFNITALRLISYNMDYFWRISAPQSPKDGGAPQVADTSPDSTATQERKPGVSERIVCRERAALDLREYNLVNYLTYAFYAPLWLAGPIITFNAFISQLKAPLHTPPAEVAFYGLRLAAVLLLMETMLHFNYATAIGKAKAWEGFNSYELSLLSYFMLKLIWIKLLVVWRFFRFWAMADQIQTHENMARCVTNNYSGLEFWRTWHRSFNRWLIRYVYVPLGGKQYQRYNIWVIFMFVALWHDISLNLLAWSWLICLFLLPEVVASAIFSRPVFQNKWWFRHLCAAAGVVNLLLMTTANLVGFALGIEGVKELYLRLFTFEGAVFVIAILAGLFVNVQVMFEIRAHELRQRKPKAKGSGENPLKSCA